MKKFLLIASILGSVEMSIGQITKPGDAPKPLPPAESAKLFRVPPGFKLELVASEPLIRQPSGMCWNERGHLFVSELHGYNLEGQYDIEELNKRGQLDKVVRRLAAPAEAILKAEKEQTGTVKRLIDTNGDGIMDKAQVLADELPACMGICPANGGIIAVCAPHIVFLADPDGDGKARIRTKLFSGFKTGIIERRINSPQWGPDNWIYVDGGQGGRISGPNLDQEVDLPVSGFRFKADGSAIEPVSGHTGTYGFTFTGEGDRFVISTQTPGIQVAPLPWYYLSRNPDVAVGAGRVGAANYNQCYPISEAHPWRTKRAADPGFNKYYKDRYGATESKPNGYFTSACSPLFYQDIALPGLEGQLLACAPAQNFIHRATVSREGSLLKLRRPSGEEQSEFLASRDIWFHPIHLSIGPSGGVWVADYYREIIEDYSAIPRYLQQQYGLDHGKDHGRVWRLVHENMPKAGPVDMSTLDPLALAGEVISPHFWRRQTARRLLLEKRADQIDAQTLRALAHSMEADSSAAAINVLYTLDGLRGLTDQVLKSGLDHGEPGVRRHALRLAESRFNDSPSLLKEAVGLLDDEFSIVRLQLALSLGESSVDSALSGLAHLARQHGNETWLDGAILSSLGGRCGQMLMTLLEKPTELGQARGLIARLCSAVATRREPKELSTTIENIAVIEDRALQQKCLQGLLASLKSTTSINLTQSARDALAKLAVGTEDDIRISALELTRVLQLESSSERAKRLKMTFAEVRNLQLPVEKRLAAVRGLSAERDVSIATALLRAYPAATPTLRREILKSAFARRENLVAVIDALEQKIFEASALNTIQRNSLLEHPDANIAARAKKVLAVPRSVDERTVKSFLAALAQKRDPVAGRKIFSLHCALCHQAHGIGFAVGPDLSSEFRRAEQTMVHDILAPSDKIVAGHETYTIETNDGRITVGILAHESAGSLTLSLPGGQRVDLLRKDIRSLKSLPISLMPESLREALSPGDVANVISWLKKPPLRRVLFDDDPGFIDLLKEGSGTATIVTSDTYSGSASLRLTPPQRYSVRIPGWEFAIRENPGPGEYRYLRLAWKSPKGDGVLIELADNGNWPAAASPKRRYFSGKNTTPWEGTQVAAESPSDWAVVTRDMWQDFGDFTLTGIAPTAMGGPVWFDQIELLQEK